MRKWIWTLALLAFMATQASAEIGVQPDSKMSIPLTGDLFNSGLKTTEGLLDLKKLSFNHTIGVSYGSGQYSGMSQYYLNDITYQVSKPLIIKAQVGVINNMSSNTRFGSSSSGGVQVVIPNVSVLYQPRPNIRLEFGFSTMPGNTGYPYYGGKYDRY